jgi:hypothetical protein
MTYMENGTEVVEGFSGAIGMDNKTLYIVTGGLKMLNSGGIKMSTCQSLTSNLRGCVDAGLRGIPHVARFIQQRIEHQRDRQKNRTQPWNGKEIPSLSSSPYTPGKIKEAQQIGWL